MKICNHATVKMLQNLMEEIKGEYARKDAIKFHISLDNVSPAELFGGTWQKVEGRFLIGASSQYSLGSNGGSANSVVVNHTHTLKKLANTGIGGLMDDGATIQRGYSGGTSGFARWTDIYEVNSTGESGTGKNMPPYLAVNIWKRVA